MSGESSAMSEVNCALLLVICVEACVGVRGMEVPRDKSAVYCLAFWLCLCESMWVWVTVTGGEGGVGRISRFSDACPPPALRSGQMHAEVWDYIRWLHAHVCTDVDKHNNVLISAQTVLPTCGCVRGGGGGGWNTWRSFRDFLWISERK